MQARSAVDPLALWRGVDDAVRREDAGTSSPPVAAEAKPAKPTRPLRVAQRPVQMLEHA